jgi:hypothetical protein
MTGSKVRSYQVAILTTLNVLVIRDGGALCRFKAGEGKTEIALASLGIEFITTLTLVVVGGTTVLDSSILTLVWPGCQC